MIPQANQIYRHFKGNLYRVITVAEHTETSEQLVIYQALYGEFKVFARPLAIFMSEVDREKYPDAVQKNRFEPVEQMVQPMVTAQNAETDVAPAIKSKMAENTVEAEDKTIENVTGNMDETIRPLEENAVQQDAAEEADLEETVTIDPLLEAYLDTDSYREKLNILHGLHYRITENMLTTMAIVIDFELPEGDIEKKYNALNDCLLTKEKYECNRIF